MSQARWEWLFGFHAYKSVVPLKLLSGLVRRLAALCRFHAYKSVAPLKRSYLHGSLIYVVWFPRLQKRGPIEAKREQKEE